MCHWNLYCWCNARVLSIYFTIFLTRTGSRRGFLNCQREKINLFGPTCAFQAKANVPLFCHPQPFKHNLWPLKIGPRWSTCTATAKRFRTTSIGTHWLCESTSRTPYGLVEQFEIVQRFIYQDGHVSLRSENIKSVVVARQYCALSLLTKPNVLNSVDFHFGLTSDLIMLTVHLVQLVLALAIRNRSRKC